MAEEPENALHEQQAAETAATAPAGSKRPSSTSSTSTASSEDGASSDRRGGKRRRGGRKKKNNKPRGRKGSGQWLSDQQGEGFKARMEQRSNDRFEAFYRQLIPADQWDAFLHACQQPLPTTFRVTGGLDLTPLLKVTLPLLFPEGPGTYEDKQYSPVEPLPWYPEPGTAWGLDPPKAILKRIPQFKLFRKWLILFTQLGYFTRQEGVSMIPPLFMDVQPHHYVLDLCAAPGSKTSQLLEALHAGDGAPSGCVVANDANKKRAYLLAHQVNRVGSPCLAVTLHDARNFPAMKDEQGNPILFDRVLADVPCSGDGTMRKSADVWGWWSTSKCSTMSNLQADIAMRGLTLLKVGGLMVYSTCSMCPYEDEAVVAELLRRCGGAVEVMDVSDQLPNLIRRPGLTSWKVISPQGEEWSSFDEVTGNDRRRYPKFAWPPTPDQPYTDSSKDLEQSILQQLPRCMRFYPHLQNTGGFFVTVLRKTRDLPTPDSMDEEDPESLQQKQLEARKNRRSKEEPWIPFDDEDGKQQLSKVYGLRDDFPWHLVMRRSDTARKLYLTCELSARMCALDQVEQVNLVNCGQRIFQQRKDSYGLGCPWRMVSESISCLEPYLDPKVILTIPHLHDLETMLRAPDAANVKWCDMSDDIRATISPMAMGSLLMRYEFTVANIPIKVKFAGWKGHFAITLMSSPSNRKALIWALEAHGALEPVKEEDPEVAAESSKGEEAMETTD